MIALVAAATVQAVPHDVSAATSLGVAIDSNWRGLTVRAAPYPLHFRGIVRNTSARTKQVKVTFKGTSTIEDVATSAFSQCTRVSSLIRRCSFGVSARSSVGLGVVLTTRASTGSYTATIEAKADGESTTVTSKWTAQVATSGAIAGSNECGPARANRFDPRARLVPDNYPPGGAPGSVWFGGSCNVHDYCYGGYNSTGRTLLAYTAWVARSVCDRNLRDALLNKCGGLSIRPDLIPALSRLHCRKVVVVYYDTAVRGLGKGPFRSGHVAACDKLRAQGRITASQVSTCKSKASSLADG